MKSNIDKEYSRLNFISNKKKSNLFKNVKKLLIFFSIEIIIMLLTAPLIIYYGPFINLRNLIVESAMTSMNHQWIATNFLSKEKIDEILSQNKIRDANQKIDEGIKKEVTVNKEEDQIELYEIEGRNFKGNLLIIHNPNRIKVGYTKELNKEGQTTSAMAKDYGAVAAINGGGFLGSTDGIAWTGTGGTPQGIIMCNGKLVYTDIEENSTDLDVVGITSEGYLIVGKYSINELYSFNVMEALSFGPALIVNGERMIKEGDGGWGIAPRTAIGQRKDGAIILLTIDGRQPKSIGATLKDVQDTLYEMGAYTAANLDGGYSTTMYYKGRVINATSDIMGERAVPSILYVQDNDI